MKCLLYWNTSNEVVLQAGGDTRNVLLAQAVILHLQPKAEAFKQVTRKKRIIES